MYLYDQTNPATRDLSRSAMRLTCKLNHEEVQWMALAYPDSLCWYCGVEGIDLVNKRHASDISALFRKPAAGNGS